MPSDRTVASLWLRSKVQTSLRFARRHEDPLFDQFLKEHYEGGHARVPNHNPDTNEQLPTIAFWTAMDREDGVFRRQVDNEFKRWKAQAEAKEDTGNKGTGAEEEESLGAVQLSPNPDRYKKIRFEVSEESEALLATIMGGENVRERALDLSGLRSIGHFVTDVEITCVSREDRTEVLLRGNGEHGLQFERTLRYDQKGGAARPSSIHNESFRINDSAPDGIATRMLATQVIAAQSEGFPKIEAFAAGRGGNNLFQGYYVWPRLGFDAEIDPEVLEQAPDVLQEELKELAGGKTPRLMHMMASAVGREWWKANGEGFEGTFPLGKEDTVSQDVLLSYSREKAKRAGKPLGEYLTRVASTKDETKRSKDNVQLSKEDDTILDFMWEKVRKRLLAKNTQKVKQS